jgi:hypothetical protein
MSLLVDKPQTLLDEMSRSGDALPLSVACFRFAIAVIAAVAGGTITILVASQDLETAGLGPIAALLVLPGVVLYSTLDAIYPGSWKPHVGFALPVVLVMAWFLWTACHFSHHPDPDGAGQMAWYIAITVLGSAGVAYAALSSATPH